MISVILIDDEMPALKELKYLLSSYSDIHIAGMYLNPVEAMAQIEESCPDAVFLDIDMPQINGMEIATKIQNINIATEIIFVTAHQEYAIQAFEIQALDYILKPMATERFHKAIVRLIDKIKYKNTQMKTKDTIWVQCFGKFQVVNNMKGETLKWRTNKAKELFAYLICNYGKTISKYDLIFELFNEFDEKKALNNLYVSMYYLRKQLNEFGIQRDAVLIKDDYTLEIRDGICDYVEFDRFLSKEPVNELNIHEYEKAIDLYGGAFLEDVDYIWSLQTREFIDAKYEDLIFLTVNYYESKDDFKKSEDMLLKLIKFNPFLEEGYKRLLTIYKTTNNCRLYIKYYEIYENVMNEELGLMPDAKYKSYYTSIKNIDMN